MLSKLTDLFKTAASFLQTGVAPPNTPLEQLQNMENINHLSSKKFFLAFSGFIILGVFYASSVAVLIFIPKVPELIAAFTTIFSKIIEVLATVMAVYLGSQAIVDLKYNSTSNASIDASVQVADITNRVVGNEKEDDYELHED
jgi:hypothetical protein